MRQKPTLKEADILSHVRSYLRWAGWYVIRIQQGLGCHKGVSDLIAVKNGSVYFIEIKTEKGKMSAYQEEFKTNIEEKGCYYFVVRSLEDIERIIKE